MDQILGTLLTAWDFALVAVGFGLIIFVHELGHFVAARWAGIRVLAFALGFGPPLLTYRKGVGLRRGSSEGEYRRRHDSMAALAARNTGNDGDAWLDSLHRSISPTEYRLNLLPLGGYVKMLGQEDLNPDATSNAHDSYQQCLPWKRMIVISAGVVMNIILASVLFLIVFMVGMRVEPAVVGDVGPDSAAAKAVVVDASGQKLTSPGLRIGDRVISIDGRAPNSFSDVMLASAMAAPGRAITLEIRRDGFEQPLRASIVPEPSPLTNLLDLGIAPSASTTLRNGRTRAEDTEIQKLIERLGATGVEPGMTLTKLVGSQGPQAIDDTNRGYALLTEYARSSQGRTFLGEFSRTDDRTGSARVVSVPLTPEPEWQIGFVPGATDQRAATPVAHLLGLMPVMRVANASPAAYEKGLRTGDVFVRIDATEFPSFSQGIAAIRARKGKTVSITVLRRGVGGPGSSQEPEREVELPQVAVSPEGTIGFEAEGAYDRAIFAKPLDRIYAKAKDIADGKPELAFVPAAAALDLSPGTMIVQVGDEVTGNLLDVRAALARIAERAMTPSIAGATPPSEVHVPVTIVPPQRGKLGEAANAYRVVWKVSLADLQAAAALGWDVPRIAGLFEPSRVLLKANSPGEAIAMGANETKRVMLSTYVTFARLFQGTVKIEHLKGPVGIAHLGTLVAGKGFVWLLFFLAMISVNLAVINFLPLPIVDGGQFLFLLFEQATGRPVPISVQNVATMAGLLMIGTVFLIVTFNDVRNLLGF